MFSFAIFPLFLLSLVPYLIFSTQLFCCLCWLFSTSFCLLPLTSLLLLWMNRKYWITSWIANYASVKSGIGWNITPNEWKYIQNSFFRSPNLFWRVPTTIWNGFWKQHDEGYFFTSFVRGTVIFQPVKQQTYIPVIHIQRYISHKELCEPLLYPTFNS